MLVVEVCLGRIASGTNLLYSCSMAALPSSSSIITAGASVSCTLQAGVDAGPKQKQGSEMRGGGFEEATGS